MNWTDGVTSGRDTESTGTTNAPLGSSSDSSTATLEGGDTTSTGGTTGHRPKFDIGGDAEPPPLPPPFPKTCAEAERVKSSVGCVFYPARVPGSSGTSGFAVSNVGDDHATVTLSDIDGLMSEAVVPPGESHLFAVDVHLMTSLSHVGSDGMVLESDQPLQAYQFMPIDAPSNADASIVLPHPALGTRHRVMTYNATSNNGLQYAAVVATEDDTEVTFTLEQPGSQTLDGDVPKLDKDLGPESVTVMLDRLQHLVVGGHREHDVTGELNEFTGSLVESNKPVAVYSGKVTASIPEGVCCADRIATAVPPTTALGREYAGVPFLATGEQKPDIWRLLGNADGTVVELSGGLEETIELDAGEFYDVMTPAIFWMEANEPFGVAHFMVGGGLWLPDRPIIPYDCEEPLTLPGDPAMSWIYPRGNWLHRYVLRTGSNDWCHDHATIVAPLDAWADITLDGAPLPPMTPIGGGSEHGYAWVPLPNQISTLEAPPEIGVAVDVYGYVDYGSYYYPGGMGLQSINPAG